MADFFRKPFNELFLKKNNFYQAIGNSVAIRQTLFTTEKVSVDDTFLGPLCGRELAGVFINDIYFVTCYFKGDEVVKL